VSTRRAFLRSSPGALAVLAAPRGLSGILRLAQSRVRLALMTSGPAAEHAVRGASLAAVEAGRTASLLGGTFELVELNAVDEEAAVEGVERARTDGSVAIVTNLSEPARSALLDVASERLPVIDAATADPARGRCGSGSFFTGLLEGEARRVLAASMDGAGGGRWSLVPRADGALGATRSDPAPEVAATVAVWHPDLFRYGATQLNERYRRAHGAGMSSAAWASWIAVKLVAELALRGGGSDLAARLSDVRARFDGHKGVPLSFRPEDGWLRQPLYVLRSAPIPLEEGIEQVDYQDAATNRCSDEARS
jgi:hypothetical protein